MKPLIATSLLALAAMSIAPAPAAADGPLACAPPLTSACNFINTCTPPPSGVGGVVGETITYAGDVASIVCNGAKQEVALGGGAVQAACGATTQYLTGGACTILICNGCTPPSEGGASVGNFIILSCAPVIGGGPGIVGMTETYVGNMYSIACSTGVGTAFVALDMTIAICNATGDYLIGDNWSCTISTT
ncbi:MAG: hypothetical protein V4510_06150 [bacterium]